MQTALGVAHRQDETKGGPAAGSWACTQLRASLGVSRFEISDLRDLRFETYEMSTSHNRAVGLGEKKMCERKRDVEDRHMALVAHFARFWRTPSFDIRHAPRCVHGRFPRGFLVRSTSRGEDDLHHWWWKMAETSLRNLFLRHFSHTHRDTHPLGSARAIDFEQVRAKTTYRKD